MQGAYRNSTILLAMLIAACGSGVSHQRQSASIIRLEFEHQDECINPALESQSWRVLNGKVSRIEPPGTLTLTDVHDLFENDDPGDRHVVLAGVRMRADAAREYLDGLIGEEVAVLVNPSNYHDPEIHAEVHLGNKSVNRTLLMLGLAEYHEPPAYSISHYSECLFKIAEREARQHHLGIWR